MPRHWWPSLDAMNAVIESDGPGPSPSPQSNGTFVPLDVDKYDDLAIVVGYGEDRFGRECLGSDEFQKIEAEWRRLGGGSGGYPDSPLTMRQKIHDAPAALHLRMSGTSDESLFDARRGYSHAIFLCGPEVVTAEIRRQMATRTADVRTGPGWLDVLWTPEDPARVSAYTAGGNLTFNWTAPYEGAA